MNGKRGRPSSSSIFLDKSAARFRTRPTSNLARQMATAVAEHVAELKSHKLYGPHVGLDIVRDLEMADLLGIPVPDDTMQQIAEALKCRFQHGKDGGARNRVVPSWKSSLAGNVRKINDKLAHGQSAALIAKHVSRNWSLYGGSSESPSERSLRRWIATVKVGQNLSARKSGFAKSGLQSKETLPNASKSSQS